MNHLVKIMHYSLFVTLCCLGRVSIHSSEHDSLTLKMLNPGYIFTKVHNLCLKLESDIGLLIDHQELYEQWIVQSDYLLDQSLELYAYVCYVLLFKHHMHSYLQEDIVYITELIQRALYSCTEFMHTYHADDIHLVFVVSVLQKTVTKSLLFINLTKEVCIPFYNIS